MPLPFAPPPKDSSLYQQLESTTLQTLTPDQLDTIRAKTFSQGTEGNEDEYRRLLLLGLASDQISISGPLAGGADIAQYTQDSGSAPAVIRPPKGEVWQIQAVALFNSLALTGNQAYYLFMSTEESMAVSTLPGTLHGDVQQSGTSSASTTMAWETLHEDLGGGPLQITHDLFLRWYGNFANTQTGNILTWSVGYIRVR